MALLFDEALVSKEFNPLPDKFVALSMKLIFAKRALS